MQYAEEQKLPMNQRFATYVVKSDLGLEKSIERAILHVSDKFQEKPKTAYVRMNETNKQLPAKINGVDVYLSSELMKDIIYIGVSLSNEELWELRQKRNQSGERLWSY